jgi:hypothetical protein
MPSPEQPADADPPSPYFQAARFSGERPAGRAYARAQDLIYQEPCDLSAYRFLLDRSWHVAVLGEPPPAALERSLRRILAWGESTTLPDDILQQLWQRRTQATKLAPWVERHVRSVPPKE